MTENLPDYTNVEIPRDAAPETFGTHERRAAVLRAIQRAGSPFAINQARLAEKFSVAPSTVSRDVDRLRESISDRLGDDAELTTKVVYERVVRDLLDEEDWRATRAAWDVVSDFNEWLADTGRQHREPEKAEMDVKADVRRADVSYTVVREGSIEDLPTDEDGAVDHAALGFTKTPAGEETTITVNGAGGDDG